MQFLKIIKALPLILIAGAFIFLSIYICLDNGAWAYLAARLMGLEEKYAAIWSGLSLQFNHSFLPLTGFMVGSGPFLTGVWKNQAASITKSI